MKNSLISGRKAISSVIINPHLNKLIDIVLLSKTQKYLIDLCRQHNVKYELKDKSWFTHNKTRNIKYKYSIAYIKRKEEIGIKELIQKNAGKERSIIVVLDHLQDPFNVGAILRTCAAAGVDGIVIPTHHQAPIDHEATLKASQGYALKVDIVREANLNNVIQVLKKNNYWIYCSNLDDKSLDLNTISFEKKSVLIMGNEGNGVSELLKKNSDFSVHIPMRNNVDSMNVSVAAGIFLFRMNQA